VAAPGATLARDRAADLVDDLERFARRDDLRLIWDA
jgi:hypothetical protein